MIGANLSSGPRNFEKGFKDESKIKTHGGPLKVFLCQTDFVGQDTLLISLFRVFEIPKELRFIPVPQRGQIRQTRSDLKNLLEILVKHVDVFPNLGTGTDKAHISFENIDELGHFINLCPSQPPSQFGNPRVVSESDRSAPEMSVFNHGTKFEDDKRATSLSDPLLPKEDRTM